MPASSSPPRSKTGASTSLPIPTVDHAKGNQLDPDDVPATGTTLRVPAAADTRDLDVVNVYWKGPRNDVGNDTFEDSLPINSWSAGEELPFAVELKYVRNNLEQQVEVFYEIIRAGDTLPSTVLELKIAPALGDLPEPRVAEAQGGSLDPKLALQGVELIISYPRMATIDRVAPYWRGTPGPGTPTLQPVDGDASGSISVKVPAAAVAANVGRSVQLGYTVSRSGAPVVDSDTATLTVQRFQPGDLPAAVITQSNDHILDLNTFSGNATITVRPWPLIAIDQRVWCTATGTRADGTPFSRILANAAPVTAEQVTSGLRYRLDRSDLDGLQHNSGLKLQLQVTFDSSSDASQAHAFPEEPLLIAGLMASLPAMTLPQASQGTLTPLNVLGNAIARVSYPSMQPSDTLVLYYTDANGIDQPAHGYWPGSTSLVQLLSIPPGLIGQFFGKPLTMQYRVIHADAHSPGGKGAAVTVNVDALDTDVLQSPMPGQAKSGELDLGTFPGDASIVLEKWFFMAPLQRVWLTAVGTYADGSSARIILADGESIAPEQVGQAMVFTLKRGDLEKLQPGSTLSFEASVSFDGRAQQAEAVAFPRSHVIVRR